MQHIVVIASQAIEWLPFEDGGCNAFREISRQPTDETSRHFTFHYLFSFLLLMSQEVANPQNNHP